MCFHWKLLKSNGDIIMGGAIDNKRKINEEINEEINGNKQKLYS